MKYLCIHIFKVKFNLSLKIGTCDKILCENTPLDFHCVEEKVFLIKILHMTGIFSGVSGAVIRPLSQWQMPTFFPNLNKKNPNQKVIFM